MAEAPGFLAEAWDELRAAANWHENRVAGLGERLYDEADQALDVIARSPRSGALWKRRGLAREVRRVPLRSFPYALFYVLEPRPTVVAFVHSRRRPGYWIGRL